MQAFLLNAKIARQTIQLCHTRCRGTRLNFLEFNSETAGGEPAVSELSTGNARGQVEPEHRGGLQDKERKGPYVPGRERCAEARSNGRTNGGVGDGPRSAVRQLEFNAGLRPSESQSRRTSSTAVRTGCVPR
jgi:hypothetical protein